MPLTNILPWICAAIVASIAAIVTGIRADLPVFAWIASSLFAIALVATALDVNMPLWRMEAAAIDRDAAAHAALRNAQLLIVGYAWGALALLAIYRLTPLRWQHGLQYGAGMAVIAWLILVYAQLLARPHSRLRNARTLQHATWLSLCHGGGALGGVLFLVVSGKVHSIKDDWGANQVFLAGGLALFALSLISAYTQMRLTRIQQGQEAVGR